MLKMLTELSHGDQHSRCGVLSWHCQYHPCHHQQHRHHPCHHQQCQHHAHQYWHHCHVKSTRGLLALDLGTMLENLRVAGKHKLRSWLFHAGISGDHFWGKILWKPGHRGKCLLLYRAERSAMEVQREPGLIALIIQSCNSFCQHEGG